MFDMALGSPLHGLTLTFLNMLNLRTASLVELVFVKFEVYRHQSLLIITKMKIFSTFSGGIEMKYLVKLG